MRNVTIQRTAEGMREIDALFQRERYEAAWRLAVDLEQQLSEMARMTNDEQLWADVELMQRYQETLESAIWQTEGRRPRLEASDNSAPAARPYRGRDEATMPTPALPTVEIR